MRSDPYGRQQNSYPVTINHSGGDKSPSYTPRAIAELRVAISRTFRYNADLAGVQIHRAGQAAQGRERNMHFVFKPRYWSG
ncbi:MAG TPA: hypothetical protein VKH40_06620 [Alloacidobacterium sp.]|nr:hypothetical protein [Alloacidobacterium sp.]